MNSSWWEQLTTSGESGAVNWWQIGAAIAVVLMVWWLAAKAEQALRKLARRSNFHNDSMPAVLAYGRIARYALWFVGSFIGLMVLGIDLTGLAFFTGAIALGIGIGLQNIFNNFLSGLILLFERTLKVGDFVDLESGVRGHVREIAMRYTRIETNDAVDVIVPNSELVNRRLINWTYGRPILRMRIPFSVAYGSDKQTVRVAAMEAAAGVPVTLSEPEHEPDLRFVAFGDSALQFELLVWVNREAVNRPGATESKYLWALDDALRKHGLEVPFPQRDLHIKSSVIGAGQASSAPPPDGGL